MVSVLASSMIVGSSPTRVFEYDRGFESQSVEYDRGFEFQSGHIKD